LRESQSARALRRSGELEIVRNGRADNAAFQTYFAGRDHDPKSQLLIRKRRSRGHEIADDFASRQDQDVTPRSISSLCQYELASFHVV
jgi:hypothetical protein